MAITKKYLSDADVTTADSLLAGDLVPVERNRVTVAMSSTVFTGLADDAAAAAASAAAAQAAADDAASSAGYRDFQTLAVLEANTTLGYSGAETVAAGDVLKTRYENLTFEVAASGASDHHLTTAGGVKIYEAGDSYTTEARLLEAITRGIVGKEGHTLRAGQVCYVYTDVGGSLYWQKQVTPYQALQVAARAIPDQPLAVKRSHMEVMPAYSFMANPSNNEGPPMPILAAAASTVLGYSLTFGTGTWNLEFPAGDRIFVGKGGNVTIGTGVTAMDVLFDAPFRKNRMNVPLLTVHTEAQPVIVSATGTPAGGGTEEDGFAIAIWEWDAATSLWVAPTSNIKVTWQCWGQ